MFYNCQTSIRTNPTRPLLYALASESERLDGCPLVIPVHRNQLDFLEHSFMQNQTASQGKLGLVIKVAVQRRNKFPILVQEMEMQRKVLHSVTPGALSHSLCQGPVEGDSLDLRLLVAVISRRDSTDPHHCSARCALLYCI